LTKIYIFDKNLDFLQKSIITATIIIFFHQQRPAPTTPTATAQAAQPDYTKAWEEYFKVQDIF